MKNKTLSILCAIFALALLITTLASCSSSPTTKSVIGDIYNTKWENEVKVPTVYQNAGVFGALDSYNDNIGVFTEQSSDYRNTTRIVNLSTMQTITTLVDAHTTYYAFANTSFDYIYAVVALSENEGSLCFYDINGTLVWEIKNIDTTYLSKSQLSDLVWAKTKRFGDALIAIENNLYSENKDGTLSLKSSYTFTGFPSITDYVGNRYFDIDSNGVVIYDENFGAITEYVLPSYAYRSQIVLLQNGNVFVQYFAELPSDANKYDVFFSSKKYDLVTLLIEAKNGKTSELDASFVLYNAVSADVFSSQGNSYLKKGIENIAIFAEIDENKCLNTDSDSYEIALMSNGGKLGKYLTVDGYDEIPQMVGRDRFLISDSQGCRVLLNAKGKVLARVSSEYKFICNYNYFYNAKAIYDLGGNVVYDLEANGATVDSAYNEYAYIIAKGKDSSSPDVVYRFASGAVEQIATFGNGGTYDSFQSSTYFYTFYNSDSGECAYYNHTGVFLANITGYTNDKITTSDFIILIDSNNICHKFLFAAPKK